MLKIKFEGETYTPIILLINTDDIPLRDVIR